MVNMSQVQLLNLGFQFGHLFKISEFLVRWMLKVKGVFFSVINKQVMELKYEIFLINLNLTSFGLRSVIEAGKILGLLNKRVWFVCHNYYFAPLVARYATIIGVGYSTYDWIAGSLTNMKRIFSYLYGLYIDWVKGFKFTQRHKVFLFRLLGLRLSGYFKPFFVLFPRLFEAKVSSYEVGGSTIISAGIVDSNMLSNNIRIPIPGNDDSALCVNFFSYMFSKNFISLKINSIKNWKNVNKENRRLKLLFFIYFIIFYSKLNWTKNIVKYLNLIVTKIKNPRWKSFLFYGIKPSLAFVKFTGGGSIFDVNEII